MHTLSRALLLVIASVLLSACSLSLTSPSTPLQPQQVAEHCQQAYTPNNPALTEAIQHIKRHQYEQAKRLLKPLAEHGHADAQAWYCEALIGHAPSPAVSQHAMHWCHQSARQGDPIGHNNLATLYGDGMGLAEPDPKAALYHLQQAAKQCEANAITNLGVLYERGLGVPKNLDTANAWYQLAARLDNPYGQWVLGQSYQQGLGRKADPSAAEILYRQAAAQNDSQGQVLLAQLYQDGLGVQQNLQQAYQLYQQAAQANNPEAQYNLAAMYHQGQYVAPSLGAAIYWYEQAAGRNDAAAQFQLATLYLRGCGVEQDLYNARKWLGKASHNQHSEAKRLLRKVLVATRKDLFSQQVSELSCELW